MGYVPRLGNDRPGGDDNIKMEIILIGWEFVDWIYLRQNKHTWTALAGKVTNLRVPQSTGEYLRC